MTQSYRYAPRTLAAGYARSAIGLVATIGAVALLHPASWLSAVLLSAGALFLLYAARTLARHLSVIELDAVGIRLHGPFGANVRWDDLHGIELDYYTTRADRSNGWMQLVVHGQRDRVRIDSTLEGFAIVTAAVARAAALRRCPIDEGTQTHLTRLGIALECEHYPTIDPVAGAHHA